MNVSVEIGQGGTELSSPPAPSNPAGLAAREELAKIMSDPAHPMHAGYMRNDKTVQDHLDGIYRKAYPETLPPSTPTDPALLREHSGLSETEREAAEDARELANLRADWERDGGSYEAGLNEAKEMALILHAADPQLYLEASRRLGDAMGLRILRLLRHRVNI